MPLTPPQAYRKTAFTHRRGTRAAQPNFADVLAGTIYYVTDEDTIERSTGAAWEQYGIKPTRNGLITTTTGAIDFANNTAATALVPRQISPAVVFTGQSWDTNDNVSRTTRVAWYNKPATDTDPFPGLYLATDVGAGFVDQLLFGSANGDAGQANWRFGSSVNIIFSRSGRGISFVANPLTDTIDSNFLLSGDVTSGNKRIKINLAPGWFFIEGNNFGAGAGVNPSMDIRNFDDSTNSPIVSIRHRNVPGGTVANGFGARQLVQINSSTTSDQNAGAFDIVWSDVTHASRTADFVIYLVDNAAALAEKLRLTGAGNLNVASYSVGGTAGAAGGTFSPVTSITVVNGLVTAIS